MLSAVKIKIKLLAFLGEPLDSLALNFLSKRQLPRMDKTALGKIKINTLEMIDKATRSLIKVLKYTLKTINLILGF